MGNLQKTGDRISYLIWPSHKSRNPEFQKALPKNEHDSRNRLPPKPKQNPLPKKPTWSNDEKSSKKPENTPLNMPLKLRPSSTTPKPPRPTEITTFQTNQNWL